MIRRATERLPLAVVASLSGALVAVIIGQPVAAVLVAPWFVLLLLGVTASRRSDVDLTVAVENNRVMVDDDVELVIRVTAPSGRIKVTNRPSTRVGQPKWRASATSVDGVVEPDRTTELPLSFVAQQWGTYDVGRVDVEVTEPYGLFRWTGTVTDPAPIRVHPPPRVVQEMVAPWIVRRTTGTHGSRSVGRGVEYADLRPFGHGDSLRDINWRVSARSPELWVSQRHPDRATDVVLLLDSFVESGHDVQTVVGLAIEAAVALAESHLAVTDRVGLIELGGLVRWVVPGTGRIQLQRLVDALLATGLYANAADRDLALIGPRALPPRSFLVALSPLLDDRFVDALYELAGRGHDVAVVECDPAVDGPSRTGSEEGKVESEVTAAWLAWRIWQAERAILRDQLGHRGVAVARWKAGDPLDLTLQELTRRRRRIGPMVHR